MKTFCAPLCFLLFLHALCTAQPVVQWQRSLGGSDYDRAHAVHQTSDGGYIIAGGAASFDGDVVAHHGTTLDDFWVVKLDPFGAVQWARALGGAGDEVATSIEQTNDGGYIVAGYYDWHAGDAWIVKINATGVIQWQKIIGGTKADILENLIKTSDGGFVFTGSAVSHDGDLSGVSGTGTLWVVKLDQTGTIQWQKLFGGTNTSVGKSIRQTGDGGYIIAGLTYSNNGDVTSNHGGDDYWVIKLDAFGNLQWQSALGGSSMDEAFSVQVAQDGGYLVAGHTLSNDGDVSGNHGDWDWWVVKLDATGALLWQKTLGGSKYDVAESILATNDGGCVITGESDSADGDVLTTHGGGDIWVVKLDPNGVIEWQKSLGGSQNELAFMIQPTNDGGYILAGESASSDGDLTFNHGNFDFWVVKLISGQLSLACPGSITVNAAPGAQSAPAVFTLPVPTTNCQFQNPPVSLIQGQASGSNFPIGTTNQCFLAKDECGTSQSCCFTVTVNATPSKVMITCPGNISVNTAPGATKAAATYNMPVATTDCQSPDIIFALTQGLPSGSSFPVGVTSQCFQAKDDCGATQSCCFSVTVHATADEQPCDTKEIGCLKFELLSITKDPAARRTYRVRVTNNCASPLIYTAIQIPDGLVAIGPADNAVYTAPSARTYAVRNPNESPFYSLRFKAQGPGIANGAADIFEYTLPAQADPTYIHVYGRLDQAQQYEAYLDVFDCPVGNTPAVSNREEAFKPAVLQESGRFQVYPNPSSGVLHLVLPETGNEVTTLRLLNVQGSLILQSDLQTGEAEIQLPATLPAGLYVLEAWGAGGLHNSVRVVVAERH
jgi:hypothetical protein